MTTGQHVNLPKTIQCELCQYRCTKEYIMVQHRKLNHKNNKKKIRRSVTCYVNPTSTGGGGRGRVSPSSGGTINKESIQNYFKKELKKTGNKDHRDLEMPMNKDQRMIEESSPEDKDHSDHDDQKNEEHEDQNTVLNSENKNLDKDKDHQKEALEERLNSKEQLQITCDQCPESFTNQPSKKIWEHMRTAHKINKHLREHAKTKQQILMEQQKQRQNKDHRSSPMKAPETPNHQKQVQIDKLQYRSPKWRRLRTMKQSSLLQMSKTRMIPAENKDFACSDSDHDIVLTCSCNDQIRSRSISENITSLSQPPPTSTCTETSSSCCQARSLSSGEFNSQTHESNGHKFSSDNPKFHNTVLLNKTNCYCSKFALDKGKPVPKRML